jgi:hypothetical protein
MSSFGIVSSCLFFLALTSVVSAYASFQWNVTHQMLWAFIVQGLQVIPLWLIVARYSTNIVRDGLIYDVVLTVVYTSALVYFQSKLVTLSLTQMIGVGLTMVGILMFKFNT